MESYSHHGIERTLSTDDIEMPDGAVSDRD